MKTFKKSATLTLWRLGRTLL